MVMMQKEDRPGRRRLGVRFFIQPVLRALWISTFMGAAMLLAYFASRFAMYHLCAVVDPLHPDRVLRGVGFSGTFIFAYVFIVGSINRRRCENLIGKLNLGVVPAPDFGFAKHFRSNSSVRQMDDAIQAWLRKSSLSFVRLGQGSWRVDVIGASIWYLALTLVADGQVRLVATHRFSFWAKTFDANFGVQGADLLLSMMLLMLRDGLGSEEMRGEVEHVALEASFARAFGLPRRGRDV